jgi:4-hydroxy-L-threonine phosphate dehydrogenase PdxA
MSTPAIAIACGDPNGIGPELAWMVAIAAVQQADPVRPVLVGDTRVLMHYRRLLAVAPQVVEAVEVVGTPDRLGHDFQPGRLCAAAGRATVAAIETALDLVCAGQARAILAAPHSETAVNASGIAFSGYGGLLADLTGTPREAVFLMLVAGDLRIAHATLHVSVAQALRELDAARVQAVAQALHADLLRTGLLRPRIGLFGINPHAGEGGLFGDEDERVTRVAAQSLRGQGLDVRDPQGGDVLLAMSRLDGYVAMFHDQGHIPIKLLRPAGAAAMSLGLPVRQASVAHGCAFDIAGRGVASPAAMLEAWKLLADHP